MHKLGGANEVNNIPRKPKMWRSATFSVQVVTKIVGSRIASLTPGRIVLAQSRARAFPGKRERRVL